MNAPKPRLAFLVVLVVALLTFGRATHLALATTHTYDTISAWNSADGGYGPFGEPTITTFGQTMVVPNGTTRLQQFQFVVTSIDTALKFHGEVYAWDDANKVVTGANLWDSGAMSSVAGNGQTETITFTTGGLDLTAGQNIVVFMSFGPEQATNPSPDQNGSIAGFGFDAFAGGYVVASNGTDDASWKSTTWGSNPGGDVAFTADFTTPISPTTTAVTTSGSPSANGQSVTFTATVSGGSTTPTGTVTFSDGATVLGSPTLVGGAATLTTSSLSVGTHSISAAYGGDTTHGPSGGSVGQVVAKASTSTALTSSPNPSTALQPVTLTATVSATPPGAGTPTGSVEFFAGATSLGSAVLDASGVATLVVSSGFHAPGASLTATYGGDPSFTGSTSTAVTQTTLKAGTTTALVSSTNPSSPGQSVTFTATVQAISPGSGVPLGTVTFFDGATVLGTATVNGATGQAIFSTSSLGVGSHSITAQYSGANDYLASTTAAPVTQVVSAAASNVTLASSVNPSTFGAAVTFTATIAGTAGSPGGTVTFLDGATPIGGPVVVSGGSATFTTSALVGGTHSITASYSGDATYTPGSATLAETVDPAPTATTLAAAPNPSDPSQSVTLTSNVTSAASGTITGTVTFKDGTSVLGTGAVSAGTATFATTSLSPGSHSLTATYGGDTSFAASTSPPLTQVVDVPDAGSDGGIIVIDAGTPDSGVRDAAPSDSGPADASGPDTGIADASNADAGGGPVDASSGEDGSFAAPDSGVAFGDGSVGGGNDAGSVDTGTVDGGGCGCVTAGRDAAGDAASFGAGLGALVLAAFAARRRKRR